MVSDFLSTHTLNLFNQYALDRLKKASTRNDYLREISFFADFISKDIIYATKDDCTIYMKYLSSRVKQNKITSNTYYRKYRNLSSFFSYLVLQNDSTLPKAFTNHFAFIPVPKNIDHVSPEDVISVDQLHALLLYSKNESLVTYLAIKLLYYSSLFPAQICELQKTQLMIDSSGNCAIEITYSNDSSEFYKVPGKLMDEINNYISKLPHKLITAKYLFYNENDSALTPRTLQNRIKSLSKKATIPYFTPSKIRNSGIVHSRINGATDHEVKKQTNIYNSYHIRRFNYAVDSIKSTSCDYLE